MKKNIQKITALLILLSCLHLVIAIPGTIIGILVGGSWFIQKLLTETEDSNRSEAFHIQLSFWILVVCCILYRVSGGNLSELEKAIFGKNYLFDRWKSKREENTEK